MYTCYNSVCVCVCVRVCGIMYILQCNPVSSNSSGVGKKFELAKIRVNQVLI